MKIFMKTAMLALGLALVGAPPAVGQEELSSAMRSNAFVQVMAIRGLECELLKPWQSAVLEAMVVEDMSRRPPSMMEQLQTEADRLGAETGCESEMLSVWIEGASPGFDREMLPPFLVAYKVLAEMDPRLGVFTSSTSREDYAPAIAAVEAKLAALEADGVMPEGGQSWPEYVERTMRFVDQFAALVADEGATGPEVEQARGWLELTGRIIELWLVEP